MAPNRSGLLPMRRPRNKSAGNHSYSTAIARCPAMRQAHISTPRAPEKNETRTLSAGLTD